MAHSKGMKKNAEDKRTKKISNNLKLNAVRFCFPFEFSIFAVLPIHFEGAACCYKTVPYSNWESIHSPHLYNILKISNISPSHSKSCIHPLPPVQPLPVKMFCLKCFKPFMFGYFQWRLRRFGQTQTTPKAGIRRMLPLADMPRSTYKQIHHISTQYTRSN